MRKVILFTAASLDGFIAGPNGEIDWLFVDSDYGYKEFYEKIDIIVMGAKTYQQVMSFSDTYLHSDRMNYIISHNKGEETPYLKYLTDGIPEFIRELKEQDGRDIWLTGGGEINGLFLEHGLIDEMIISVHPVVLGKGITLFGGKSFRQHFLPQQMLTYETGLLQMFYKKV